MKRKTLPKNHSSIADTLNNLGNLYYGLGDKYKAKELYEQALKIRKVALPKNHASMGDTLNNLGVVYKDIGDIVMAKKSFEKAFGIFKKSLPQNHPLLKRFVKILKYFG